MNIQSAIVLAAVAIAVLLALFRIVHPGSGGGGCGCCSRGNCDGCSCAGRKEKR